MMAEARRRVPVLGFAAHSGAGKTTLIKAVIPRLKSHGLRIGVIKHAHHGFEIDYPGKDSYEVRKAGADQVLVGSASRWALIVETDSGTQPELSEMMKHLVTGSLDLILVEGFKPASFPKIELHRHALNKPLLCEQDETIIAVATDSDVPLGLDLPLLNLNDTTAIADFIIAYCFSET